VIWFDFYMCYKYVESLKIVKFPVLLHHLLLIKGAEYAFHHNGESAVMSVLLIGALGVSKSLSVNLYSNYYKAKTEGGKKDLGIREEEEEKDKDKDEDEELKEEEDQIETIEDSLIREGTHMFQYLCSRASEAVCLSEQFIEAVEFLKLRELSSQAGSEGSEKYPHVSISLDEIGLANLNSMNPLKVMHSIQDKGVEIGSGTFQRLLILETSNYALDFAIQNR